MDFVGSGPVSKIDLPKQDESTTQPVGSNPNLVFGRSSLRRSDISIHEEWRLVCEAF